MKKYDVLIVGCGPSGATLANLLRLYGYTVAIFDRDKEIFIAPRAMQIDPPSCRIFQSIDIQTRLEERDARPARRHIFVDSNRKPLLELFADANVNEHGHHQAGMRFHQPSLERFLRDDFDKGVGVDAFLGYEVTDIANRDGSASLTATHPDTGEPQEFTGRYIVGADGGGSLCRKFIGAKRIDFNYSRQWIVMDMIVHDQKIWDSIIDRSEFRCRHNAAVVYVKGCHNHVRLDFEVSEERAKTFDKDDALALISEYFDPSSIEFQRMVPYHFYAGMPEYWRKGRVFLMGDAAHLTSPFSGQGLNMGIRDAANLAFKFDLVFKGLADDRLLDTYQSERWENCESVIKAATKRGLMISTGSVLGLLRRQLIFSVAKIVPKMALASSRRAGVGFPYLQGLIGRHKRAGYQIFQPKLQARDGRITLMDDMIGHNFALISLHRIKNSDLLNWFESTMEGVVLTEGEDFFDQEGLVKEYMRAHNMNCVLIRPDRYIFDAGFSPNELLLRLQDKMVEYGQVVPEATKSKLVHA